MRHYINQVPNLIDGTANTADILPGSSVKDEFRFDKAGSNWHGADRITGFNKNKDKLGLDGGGQVFWSQGYDGAGNENGYHFYSTADSAAGNNVLAKLGWHPANARDRHMVEEPRPEHFVSETILAGRASHDIVDLSAASLNQTIDLSSVPQVGTSARAERHVVIIDGVTKVSGNMNHAPDEIENFVDGRDRIALSGGGDVWVQYGYEAHWRVVVLRSGSDTSDDRNVLAHIDFDGPGIFNEEDLVPGTRYHEIFPGTIHQSGLRTRESDTSGANLFIIDNLSNTQFFADQINGFTNGRDLLRIEGGGEVWVQYGQQERSRRDVHIRSSEDETDDSNFLATIRDFRGILDQEDFMYGTTVHRIAEYVTYPDNRATRTGRPDFGEGEKYLFVVDDVAGSLNERDSDGNLVVGWILGFIDGRDKLKVDGATEVWVQNGRPPEDGSGSPPARDVFIRSSNDTNAADNLLARIESFEGTFDAGDLIGDLTVHEIL